MGRMLIRVSELVHIDSTESEELKGLYGRRLTRKNKEQHPFWAQSCTLFCTSDSVGMVTSESFIGRKRNADLSRMAGGNRRAFQTLELLFAMVHWRHLLKEEQE